MNIEDLPFDFYTEVSEVFPDPKTQVLFMGGCGIEQALLVRRVMRLAVEGEPETYAEMQKLLGLMSDDSSDRGKGYALLSVLYGFDLIEYGVSIRRPWVTARGTELLRVLDKVAEEVEGSGGNRGILDNLSTLKQTTKHLEKDVQNA